MRHKLLHVSPAWIAITLVAVGAIIWVVWAAPPPADSDDWAAWFQGGGTIFAVTVALWAGGVETRAASRRRRDERLDFVNGAIDAVQYADACLDDLLIAIRRRDIASIDVALPLIRSQVPHAPLFKLLAEPLSAWPSSMIYTRAVRFDAAMRKLMSADSSPYHDMRDKDPMRMWAQLDFQMNEFSAGDRDLRAMLGKVDPGI